MTGEMFSYIETQESSSLQDLVNAVPALLRCDSYMEGSVVYNALVIAAEAAEAELAIRSTPAAQGS